MGDFLILAFVFLIAGVIAVPIASRLGLGSVLGYLIAGIAISPVLSALHVDVISLQHFAEFGVVMMLFLVGLELEPKMLWQMKHKLLGLGGLQVTLTTLAVMGIALLFGQPTTVALAIGLVLALSSTAIIVQSLNEKGLMKSEGGQNSFSVLLFQDIAVIPMLALIPLLALPELADLAASSAQVDSDDHGSITFVEHLPGWARALVTIVAIMFIIVAGHYLTRPVFRYIAMANLREMFTATALLFVIGIALLMTLVGVSPALGTFIAGVVLATSEYRHELESDISPFKGLLLGLFFMTVGASINFGLLGANFFSVIGMTLGLMALKAVILLGLSKVFKIAGSHRWLFSLSLAQAGEFGFVLLSFTVANHVLPQGVADRLLLVVALSMLLTPFLFILYDKFIEPRFEQAQQREPDDMEQGNIIIAGHGKFGGVINRLLRASGYETVVLDYNSTRLENLRKFGLSIFFGDATRPDLLEAAGIEHADVLIIAIDDREQITELTRYAAKNYPNLHVISRAVDRHHVYELYAAGSRDIIRDTFDSAIRTGRSALEALGLHPFEAEQRAQSFVTEDKKTLVTMASLYRTDIPVMENEAYIEKSKELMAEQEAALQGLPSPYSSRVDRAWHPPKKPVE
ncbi:MAG: monovalent cation:proton antiporter-2 (CPA2) family protein [Gammaproteobacteria bacterium]|nr:monovalent cation:proton antiporter-2 (CPA2) family protein [Gammaproteobacteria bacterium]